MIARYVGSPRTERWRRSMAGDQRLELLTSRLAHPETLKEGIERTPAADGFGQAIASACSMTAGRRMSSCSVARTSASMISIRPTRPLLHAPHFQCVVHAETLTWWFPWARLCDAKPPPQTVQACKAREQVTRGAKPAIAGRVL